MSVWLCIPSARPVSEIAERLGRWRSMGYKIALWRNGPHRDDSTVNLADFLMITEAYFGWGKSINMLAATIFENDPSCDWIVGGGDDTEPDMTRTAELIAAECFDRFECLDLKVDPDGWTAKDSTFGVMQPTGDRWGADEPWALARFPDAPAYIDRICGSPWIGREFARRMNGGKGPFWPEYPHMFADEELQEVAKRMGVLWQRRDLTHHHEHPRRDGSQATPDFAQEIYSAPHWEASKALFDSRQAAGFPGSEPIA